jgi:hypothetical protein
VAFNYEAASRLFRRGEFLSLVQAAGRNHTERKTLDLIGIRPPRPLFAHRPSPPSVSFSGESGTISQHFSMPNQLCSWLKNPVK